jgi:hypothetical protein
MAGIAPGIRTALLADGTVTAVVSTRVYFTMLPQEPTYPAITLQLISGDPHNALNSLPALVWSRVRANSWGKTFGAANALALQVEAALNGQTATVTGLVIRSCVADGMRSFYEPAVEAHYASQDYRIWHKPA